MTTNQRETPETDAEELKQTQRSGGYLVKAEFARGLERRLGAANELLELHRDQHKWQLESDSIVASCGCLTKTNEARFHAPGCKYRLICERDEVRALVRQKDEALAKIVRIQDEFASLGMSEIRRRNVLEVASAALALTPAKG